MTKKRPAKKLSRGGLPKVPLTREEHEWAAGWKRFYAAGAPIAISASMMSAVKAGGTASSTPVVNISHQPDPAAEVTPKPRNPTRRRR